MNDPARLALIGLLLAGVVAMGACHHPGGSQASVDKGWEPVQLDHAKRFSLAQRGVETAVVVFGANGPGDTIARFHLAPPGAHGTDPFHGRGVRFSVPVQRAVLLSTTHVPFAEVLSGYAGISAAALPATPSPVARRAVEEGRLNALAPAETGQREQRIAMAADAVFDHPFGHAAGSRHEAEWIPVCEYLEDHPLGRAEWLLFFGAFLGEQARADSMFHAIAERYEATRAALASVTHRPTVFFGSAWQGQWSVPPGNSLMAALIADAGGDYLFATRTAPGNLDLHMEQVLSAAVTAERWGMVVDLAGPERIDRLPGMDPRILALPALAVGRVFIANTRTRDLFGQALLEPDLLLMDLVRVIHPDRAPDHRPRYFSILDQ